MYKEIFLEYNERDIFDHENDYICYGKYGKTA